MKKLTRNLRRVLTALFLGYFPLSLLAEDTRWVGGDISLLPSYEQYDTPYYDADGNRIDDVVGYLHDVCRWNACRVRLFVNPKERTTGAHTGVVQDIEYVKALGRRIKEAGMQLMVDLHYSDCWADPSYQEIPQSWCTDTSNAALADSVYAYTKRTLEQLTDYGAAPDYVQVGNEISYGMLLRNNSDKVYPSQTRAQNAAAWDRLTLLLGQGCKAVREVCPGAKIVVHTERSGNASQTCNYYNYIGDVDYDIIGLSYYCFCHGSLSSLSTTLQQLATQLPGKKVQIVETAYFYQYYPSDATYNYTSTWAATEPGQLRYTQDLIAELQKHDNVTGLYWWFPEENGNGGASWDQNKIVIDQWLNRGLWNDNNHKPLLALYALKDFRGDEADIAAVSDDARRSAPSIYTLQGRPVRSSVTDLAPGVYIIDGQMVMRQ